MTVSQGLQSAHKADLFHDARGGQTECNHALHKPHTMMRPYWLTVRRADLCKVMKTFSAAYLLVLAAGLPALSAPPGVAGESFAVCGTLNRSACVVDGDTIDYHGQRIRMIDYDAPEIGEPKCAGERALGHRAKDRLVQILNSGEVEIRVKGKRDEDRYGRKLRLVLVNGHSVGDMLIAEGLAWPWEGRRHRWCGQP